MSRIRVIAIAVISRPTDGALLVYDGYDTVKRELYHRPLGGGIEFGETAEAAVRRELHEEIGVQLDAVALLGFLENLFTCDGRPGHQIVAVFSARLVDASLYACNEIAFVDNGVPGTARWLTPAAFRSEQNPHGPPLYPDGLASLLDRVPAYASPAKNVTMAT
jgi:8-oxo-dGTP pyrophosphatase MutT (NUDIX family)